MEKDAIDFVVTWVDGSDERWRREKRLWKEKLTGQADDREERYRDFGLFRYWFRGVEKNAPWVRRVYFVTADQVPEWMNTDCEKLVVTNHRDYIPKEYLPTFSSHPIELNFHRIPGLSRRFVYFNDDMFLLRPVGPEFFFKGEKPRDMLALQPIVANESDDTMPYIFLNNAMVLARHFRKRDRIRNYFHIGYPLYHFLYNVLELSFPRFTGLYTPHGPSALKRSVYEELWEKEPRIMHETCLHRFRSREDVSPYLLREWMKLSGDFVPVNVDRDLFYGDLSEDNSRILSVIRRRRKKIACINDSYHHVDFERTREQLQEAFESIFPEKSGFER